jgi:hypothetical protein
MENMNLKTNYNELIEDHIAECILELSKQEPDMSFFIEKLNDIKACNKESLLKDGAMIKIIESQWNDIKNIKEIKDELEYEVAQNFYKNHRFP